MAKMRIIGDPFKDLALAIDKAGGNLKTAVDEALTESSSVLQNSVKQAALPYAKKGGGRKGYATGEMYNAVLSKQKPTWAGDVASIDGGYDLSKIGGLHSIFVMYGTPRYSKDTKVWNSIKGAKIKKRIENTQKLVLTKALDLAGGKQ